MTDVINNLRIEKVFAPENLGIRGKWVGRLRAAQLGTTPQFILTLKCTLGIFKQ